MKLMFAMLLVCAALSSVRAEWLFKQSKETAGLSDIRIDGKSVKLMPGVASGVVVQEIGSRDGKPVRLPKTDRYAVKLDARRSGQALFVTVEITDTRGGGSAADVLYQVPLDLDGLIWHQSVLTAVPASDAGSRDEIPISVLTDAKAGSGLAVAITPETPCMFAAGYDKRTGLYVKAKVGFSDLTNPPSKARISFAVYPVDAEWGFRSALKEYYTLFPKAFAGKSKVNGLWIFQGKATTAPNSPQFSFHALGELGECKVLGKKAIDIMTPDEIAKERGWGIEIYPYVIPGQREVGFLDHLKGEVGGTYREMTEKDDAKDLTNTRYTDAEAFGLLEHMTTANITISQQIMSVPDYIKTVKNSYLTRADGSVNTRPRVCRWSDKTVTFPMNPNPFIAGSEEGLNAGKAILNDVREWLKSGDWAGIYVDSLYRWGAYVNYRREQFPYAKYGLTYGDDGRPCLDNSLEHLTFLDELRKLVGPSRNVTANGVRERCFFHAHRLDVAGSEFGPNTSLEGMAFRRSMMYHKPYLGMAHGLAGKAKDRAYLVKCFLFGMYGSSDMPYFSTPDYEKVRDIYDTYVPVMRQVFALGWEPVTHARALTDGVLMERFGEGPTVYLTLYRDSGSVLATDVELDATGLKLDEVKATDPITGKALAVSREHGGRITVRNVPLSKDGMGVVRLDRV